MTRFLKSTPHYYGTEQPYKKVRKRTLLHAAGHHKRTGSKNSRTEIEKCLSFGKYSQESKLCSRKMFRKRLFSLPDYTSFKCTVVSNQETNTAKKVIIKTYLHVVSIALVRRARQTLRAVPRSGPVPATALVVL